MRARPGPGENVALSMVHNHPDATCLLGVMAVHHQFYILDFLHDQPRASDHLLARCRDTVKAFSFANKELQAQFLFQEFQLLADPGLRRIESLGRGGDVEPVIDDRNQVLQLL